MPSVVGVLSIQGDFAKHIEAFERLEDAPSCREVRTPDDLADCDRLVIPGGESTTVGLLLERYGLGEAIRNAAREGMAIWGTCMGMILLSREVEGRDQYRLGLLDVTVRRNAFGSQIHSFEDKVEIVGIPEPVMGVFIRAPIVTKTGPGVSVLGRYGGDIVAVQQGKILGTSFHPELTEDTSLHEYFLKI